MGSKLVNADILATGGGAGPRAAVATRVVLTIDAAAPQPGRLRRRPLDRRHRRCRLRPRGAGVPGRRRGAGIGRVRRDARVASTAASPARSRSSAGEHPSSGLRGLVRDPSFPRGVQRRLRPNRCPRRAASTSATSGGPGPSAVTSGSSAGTRSTGSTSSASWRPRRRRPRSRARGR